MNDTAEDYADILSSVKKADRVCVRKKPGSPYGEITWSIDYTGPAGFGVWDVISNMTGMHKLIHNMVVESEVYNIRLFLDKADPEPQPLHFDKADGGVAVITKPSQIVRAMLVGLRKFTAPEYSGLFKLNTSTFGVARRGVCIGCAATCAVMEIYGQVFEPEEIDRRDQLVGQSDLVDFEVQVDKLRYGDVSALFKLLNMNSATYPVFDGYRWHFGDLPVLTTTQEDAGHPLSNLKPYDQLLERLEKAGL